MTRDRIHPTGPVFPLFLAVMTGLSPSFQERLQSLGLTATARVLVVRVAEQKLLVVEQGEVRAEYPVSTGLKGVGERLNTNQTPRGLHRIRQKIGQGLPQGAIFESREFKGQIWVPSPNRPRPAAPDGAPPSLPAEAVVPDLVTSRILWLDGLEPGVNRGMDKEGVVVDSYQRYIYIHGTNSERWIGTPASQGCIRMLNADVIALFDLVQEGDLVWIEE